MYGLLVEDKRPLQKLMECKFTPDGKYVVFEGRAYHTETGEEVPLTEGWSLSDILHAGADVLSAGLDFVIPGSGAIIDTLNALSYVIEAQFAGDKEKDSLYLMAAITFAFVVLPGPLQAIAIPLKRAVKTGVGLASKVVVKGLKIIGGSLKYLLTSIPKLINKALKSPLAKNILGKFGKKISSFVNSFTSRVTPLLEKITAGANKVRSKVGKKGVTQVAGDSLQKMFTIKNCQNMRLCNTKVILKNFTEKLPTNIPFNPAKVKVLKRTNVAGREVAEVQLENGSKVLFYKSSGSNVATTGKKGGEWFTIPGFAEDGWFIKTAESVALTKGGNKYATSMAKHLEKGGIESLGKQTVKKVAKVGSKIGGKINLRATGKKALSSFFSKMPKIQKGTFFLRRMGFVPGKAYRYAGPSGKAMTGTIQKMTDNGVEILFKRGNRTWTTAVPVETFVKNAVGAPWMRRGASVLVPLFVKRLSDVILDDGSIDYAALEKMPDLDPNVTSKESLDYMSEEVASYEGGTGEYSTNNNAMIFQNALMLLGYPLPKFGADGKFGPETQEALKSFQQANNLSSSIGKMDRYTAKKMSELLKSKNIANSNDLQNSLNKI